MKTNLLASAIIGALIITNAQAQQVKCSFPFESK